MKKPVASLGSLLTLFTSSKKIEKYIKENNIGIVMPRSTFPACMVNQIKSENFKTIFDADGLPIEERVDFAGLKKNGRMYNWLKSIETKMLKNADRVITRSQKAIEIHLQNIGENYRNKFSVVQNGRDASFFNIDFESRKKKRKDLQLTNETLFVYCGSLGDQYCLDEMQKIFSEYRKNKPAKFLILTGNLDYAESRVLTELRNDIILKKVPFLEIPQWLNAADIAFALRKPTFSMQGVAPIKLGEYLLCGIPTVASKGIGDSETILQEFEDCYIFDHGTDFNQQRREILTWMSQRSLATKFVTHEMASNFFSMEAAVESYRNVITKVR